MPRYELLATPEVSGTCVCVCVLLGDVPFLNGTAPRNQPIGLFILGSQQMSPTTSKGH